MWGKFTLHGRFVEGSHAMTKRSIGRSSGTSSGVLASEENPLTSVSRCCFWISSGTSCTSFSGRSHSTWLECRDGSEARCQLKLA